MKLDKSYLKSKTLWTSLITVLAPLFPVVQTFINDNPEIVITVVGGIFGLLRIKTDTKIVIKENKSRYL